MPHELLGRKLLLLTAHPDDEAFLVAGTAWQNYKRGGQTAIICATLGERGTSHLKKPMTKARLKSTRRRELLNSARLAYIKPIHILGLPDAGVEDHEKTFFRRSWIIIKKNKPDAILTFGPDGLTGHRDHITCWRVGQNIARQAGIPLYIFAVPPKFRRVMAKWLMTRRAKGRYVQKIAPYAKATLRIPLPRGLKRKILHQHPSQMDHDDPFKGYPPGAAREFSGAEYFARA